MHLTESDIARALEELRTRALVVNSYGASGRVLRYAHCFGKVYKVPSASISLLATLMLRGPQTVSELRSNGDRLHSFSDNSSVEGYLEEMAGGANPTVVRLAKQTGSREPRWAHLLCGDVLGNEPSGASNANSAASLEERVRQLESEVGELRTQIRQLSETLL